MTEKSHNFVKIFAIILQSDAGARFYSKYYTKHFGKSFYCPGGKDLTKIQNQRAFEGALLSKAKRMEVLSIMKPDDTEIFNYGRFIVLFKLINELQIYVVGDQEQNEIFLSEVLATIQKVLSYVTKENLSGNHIYDILQQIILVVDQIVDEGIPVTLEPYLIYSRIKMKETEPASPEKSAEQKGTFSSLFGFAKSSLQKTLNFG